MQPLGCLPQLIAYSSGNSCNGNWTSLSFVHNQKLLQQVQKLNDQTKKNAVVVLDLYNAFLSAITKQTNRTGNLFNKKSVILVNFYDFQYYGV